MKLTMMSEEAQLKNFKVPNMNFKVPNMNFITQTLLSKTHHVLSTMFTTELSWFLLKVNVHHPGPESIMATSQLKLTIFVANHTPVLT